MCYLVSGNRDRHISYQYDADGLLTAYEQKDCQHNLFRLANTTDPRSARR